MRPHLWSNRRDSIPQGTALADQALTAIHQLSGLKTSDGWQIGSLVAKAVYQTGGAFSTGYIAKHDDGREGFLKALDFSIAERASDKIRALEDLTRVYNFERDVLKLCRGEHLSKVVVAITDGSIEMESAPFGEVFYLIFELADGDIRKHVVASSTFDSVWILRTLHHIAVGISQLHGHGIYHQDIKPSNILVFEQQRTSKLADLGRAHCKTIEAPHDLAPLPGARSYAPPEQLYNFHLQDRMLARASADLYLLGSMAYFLFTGTMLTPSIVSRLRPEHRPPMLADDDGGWRGYFEDVLPYVEAAFSEALGEFRQAVRDRLGEDSESMAGELVGLLANLAAPHPVRRGHPGEATLRHSDLFALRRFVSAFDRLALRAEFRFRKASAEAA